MDFGLVAFGALCGVVIAQLLLLNDYTRKVAFRVLDWFSTLGPRR